MLIKMGLFSYKEILNSNNEAQPLNDADIKRLQNCLIACAGEILEACNKYGIKLILQGGTLLGYARHNGFIPWDDDRDFGLLRADYEKFISVFEDELSDKYMISAPKQGFPSYGRFVQLYRKNTVLSTGHEDNSGRPQTVFIDIFPLDYAPNSKFVQTLKGVRANVIMGMAGCRSDAAFMTEYEKRVMCSSGNGKMLYLIRSAIGKAASWRSPKRWFERVDDVIAGKHQTGFITSGTGRKHYIREIIPTDAVLPLREADFEGLHVYIPNQPEVYLKNLYGDYMSIPPEEERERHFATEIKVL